MEINEGKGIERPRSKMVQAEFGRGRVAIDVIRRVFLHRVKGLHVAAERNAEGARNVAVNAQDAVPGCWRARDRGANMIRLVGVIDGFPWIGIEADHVRMGAAYK